MKMQKLAITLTVVNLLVLAWVVADWRPAAAQQGVAPVVRTNRLEIVDAKGQVRAQLNIEPGVTAADGKTYPEAAVFRLRDPEGLIRVKLAADKNGSGLLLSNDTQQPGVHILANDDGSSLRLANENGREQLLKP